MIALILLMGLLIVYPLVMVMFGSFKAGGPLVPSPFSLQGYIDAFSKIMTYTTLWTTLWLGIVRALLCLVIAIGLAWVVTRTDTPWRRFLEVAIWMAFFLPYQPYVMAWIVLAGGKSGMLNFALMNIFPWLESAPLDLYSYGGIIWVTILKWPVVIFILITPAFRGMDASLEESSKMSGASTFTTLRRVTLPVLAPALLAGFLYALIRIMESFEIEMLLGFTEGIFVFSTRVYALISYAPVDYPQGMALSSVFLVMIIGLIIMQWRLLRRREFTTVTGRGFATRPTRLGRFKYVTLGLVLLYIFVAIVMPLGAMIAGSFAKAFGVWGWEHWTLEHWQYSLTHPMVWNAIKNSLVLAISAATLGMFIYSLVTYIVIRTKLWGRKVVDVISWLPWGVPGMVMALGLLWAYIGGLPVKFLYGSMFLLIMVNLVVFFPFGCRVMTGTLHQLGKELEESSRVLGASWLHTFRHIVIPILAPSFVASWVIIFMLSLVSLTTIIFLYGPKTMPVSALIFDLWISGHEMEKAVVLGVMLSFIVLAFAIFGRWLGAKAGGQFTAN